MIAMVRQRRRRPAPPSVRLHADVPWTDPAEVAPSVGRRIASTIELLLLIAVLGVLLTAGIGVMLLMAFFAVDFLVG